MKSKFAPKIEAQLDEYMLSNIEVCAVEMNFGRLETEKYLIDNYKDAGILNSLSIRE